MHMETADRFLEEVSDSRTVDTDGRISDAITRMLSGDISSLFVKDGRRYAGMVSLRDILQRRSIPLHTKVGNLASHPPVIGPGMAIPTLVEMFHETGYDVLPVVKQGGLVGQVRRTCVLDILTSQKDLASLLVDDVMTTNVISIWGTDTLERARHMMLELDEDIIPVKSVKGRLLGGITLSDACRNLWRPGRRRDGRSRSSRKGGRSPRITASSIARPWTVSVATGTPLVECVRMMKMHGGSPLLVLDGENRPAGILTLTDIEDILLRSVRREEGVYIQISGLRDADPFMYDAVDTVLQRGLKRIAKFERPSVVNLHIVRYRRTGNRVKHSVRLRLTTRSSIYSASGDEWDLVEAIRGAMGVLERLVRKRRGKG